MRKTNLKDFKQYFWEVEIDKLNLHEDAPYIIKRILEYGNLNALRWLFKVFNKNLIKKTVLSSREFSPRTANFWQLIFNLKKEEMLCLKKSYQKMRETHWPY